jgi:hypothetical protein
LLNLQGAHFPLLVQRCFEEEVAVCRVRSSHDFTNYVRGAASIPACTGRLFRNLGARATAGDPHPTNFDRDPSRFARPVPKP